MRRWLGATSNFRNGAGVCLSLLKKEFTSLSLNTVRDASKINGLHRPRPCPSSIFAPSQLHKPSTSPLQQGLSRGLADAVLFSSKSAAVATGPCVSPPTAHVLQRTRISRTVLSALRPALREIHVALSRTNNGAAAISAVPRGAADLERGLSRLFLAPAAFCRGLTTTAPSPAISLVNGGAAAERGVSRWLYFCSAWVFSMVVLGGVTRLTRSGLSMTDWRFTGSLPPLSEGEWIEEFDKYKQSPEFKRVNRGMRMDEFKFIYYMEYAHRMWGRGLGLAFALPAIYFTARGYITRPLALRLGLLFTMGGAQGFVGWWMVKSGLEEPRSETDVPRVSPYRLAAHLTSAFAIYSLLVWTALSVAKPAANAAALAPAFSRARRFVHPVAALVGLTALSGAFVAGNDAGHAFNTWPLMGDTWIPEGILDQQPFIRNFFENTATVQFDHRMLAYTTLASVLGLWGSIQRLPLPPHVHRISHAMLAMTGLQVTLGILTVLHHVPVSLGATHQAGALTLFTILLYLMHSLRSRRLHPTLTSATQFPRGQSAPSTISPTPFTQSKSPALNVSGPQGGAMPVAMVGAKGPTTSSQAAPEYEGMASLFYKK